MTPRPLHHWKSFWLGMLVIAFLGWAWRDATIFRSLVVTGIPPRFAAVHDHGRILLQFIDPSGPGTFFAIGGTERHPIKAHDKAYLPGLAFERRVGQVFNVSLPHWFLILLFLAPWSGLLAWRWRRERKASQLAVRLPGEG